MTNNKSSRMVSWAAGLAVVSFTLLLAVDCTENDGDGSPPRIGIVGAGLSGTSSAYYLRQLFGENAHIDIFEAERVGGRTALININGQEYEAGASVIHVKNRYMMQFSELFFKDKPRLSKKASFVGLYNNDGIVFQTSEWMAVTLAKLAWRYGIDFYTVQQWTKNHIITHFDRIYDFQSRGMAFTTVEDLLRAMGDSMYNMTQHSMKDVLLDAGLSQKFVDEFAFAAMRNNYGQSLNAHGFVGAVAMCGIEPGLWANYEGNKQIPIKLLQSSKANLIQAKVTTIALIKGGDSVSYELEYEMVGSEEGQKAGIQEYDFVIIAAPLEGTKFKVAFAEFSNSVTPFAQTFHKTIAMFVEGRINKTTFNLEKADEFPPALFTISPDVFFSSVGKLSPVVPDSKPTEEPKPDFAVWKTFLNKNPTEEQISALFEEKRDLRLVEWLAYPEYSPKMDLPAFVLNDKLYYVNAIESAAAAMEMNVIGAKNVALLAFNHWQGNFDKIDELHLPGSSPSGETRTDL